MVSEIREQTTGDTVLYPRRFQFSNVAGVCFDRNPCAVPFCRLRRSRIKWTHHTHTQTHTHTRARARVCIYMGHVVKQGTGVAQWLRCCATNRKVAGSIPDGVMEFVIDIKSFRSHYGPGVDSASNRNEYQEHFLVVKADNLTTILCRCHEIWEP